MSKLPFVKSGPKISVIVPAYNVEKTLEECLDSILAQSYENLEIIVVDDGSTDGTAQIIAQYAGADRRIHAVTHEKNMGLFQARMTGLDKATGAYIAFVDGQDSISVDWFRLLLRNAEKTNADITVAQWCYNDEDGHKEFANLDHFRLDDIVLEDEQILNTFMEVQGRNPSWSVVWNKLYTKELWMRCHSLFKEFCAESGNVSSWEEIVFSSALWAFAKKVTNVHGCNYFAHKNKTSAKPVRTTVSEDNQTIENGVAAISFMKKVLEKKGVLDTYRDDYLLWKKWVMNSIYQKLVITQKKKALSQRILAAFDGTKEDVAEPDNFFCKYKTPLHDSFSWLEDAKCGIMDDKTAYVSFDIFDTLIERPFADPTDLFELLSERFNENLHAYINFKNIRQDAERAVRQYQSLHNPSREEITLDEIYDYIAAHYAFDPCLIDEIKKYEIELELRFCSARKIGKELYDLALDLGKKVIICSDMYLTRDVIETILKSAGITDYHKLYVSSEIDVTKGSKNLYKFVQKDLQVKNAEAFIHMGDNWISDVENARACGWRGVHIPKATDIMNNRNPAMYGGEAFQKIFHHTYFKEDYQLSYANFTAIRSMTGLIANKFFGNPFVSINPDSDFNVDPRYIGYAALGPHLLAMCKWIHERVRDRKIGTVHFVARDGYIIKQAYDSMGYSDSKTNYLRLSRKALVLADVESVADIYSFFNKMKPTASPKEYAKYLDPIIPADRKEKLADYFQKHDLQYTRPVKNVVEWERCMKTFIDEVIDMSLLPEYKAKMRAYFAEIIQPGDYIFDIGYSGRPEAALSALLGFPVGSLYIHVNGEIAAHRQQKYNCPTDTFYHYKPSITAAIREHIFMELGPSTTGYQETEEGMKPVLEEYEPCYNACYVTNMLQKAAIEFVKDYCHHCREFKTMFIFQDEVASAVFEYYMHYSKLLDRGILSAVPFEDDFGGGGDMNALGFWNNELAMRNIGTGTGNTFDENNWFEDIYPNGLYVKFYRWLNRKFPRGSGTREKIKNIVRMFVH